MCDLVVLLQTADGTNSSSTAEVQRFLCDNSSYNDMATLFYNPQETAIKQLFHHSGALKLKLLIYHVFFGMFFKLCFLTIGPLLEGSKFVFTFSFFWQKNLLNWADQIIAISTPLTISVNKSGNIFLVPRLNDATCAFLGLRPGRGTY